MKKLLILSAALAALTVTTLQAQDQGTIYAPQNTSVFTCAAQAATNVAFVIDCRKQASVNLQIESICDAAGTAAINYSYSRSVDGLTYSTSPEIIGTAANGNTKVVTLTNIPTWGAGYIKINWATNAAATAIVTNAIVRYGVKIRAP